MPAKKINVIIWLIKAAELDVIKQSCLTNLVGLHFDLIYTLPYAMCLSTVSQIFQTIEVEDDKNIISTTRFSCLDILSEEDTMALKRKISEYREKAPVTVSTMQKISASYFEQAVEKAALGMEKTYLELADIPNMSSFTLLVVNNDQLPLLELLATSKKHAITIPTAGEVVQLRFNGSVNKEKVNLKLVYASHHPVQLPETEQKEEGSAGAESSKETPPPKQTE